jgi:hypothetical protein
MKIERSNQYRNDSNLKRRSEASQMVHSRTAITTQQTATKITYYTLKEILKEQK